MNGKGRNAIIITTMAAIRPFGLRVETSACVPVRLGPQGRGLRQRDVGRVGHVLACGVHGGFYGGREFAERVGPGPGLGFVQVERRLLVPVGLSGRQVAASCGLGLGCRRPFLAGGSRVFLHGRGDFDDWRGVRVLGAFGLAQCAGILARGLVVRVRGFRQALVLEEADPGGGVVHAVDRRAHHGVNDPVVVVARPLAGEPRVHEERGVVAVRGLERLRVLHPLQVHGHAGRGLATMY